MRTELEWVTAISLKGKTWLSFSTKLAWVRELVSFKILRTLVLFSTSFEQSYCNQGCVINERGIAQCTTTRRWWQDIFSLHFRSRELFWFQLGTKFLGSLWSAPKTVQMYVCKPGGMLAEKGYDRFIQASCTSPLDPSSYQLTRHLSNNNQDDHITNRSVQLTKRTSEKFT